MFCVSQAQSVFPKHNNPCGNGNGIYTANSINVVGSKHKTTRQDRMVVWDFLMNELIKISFASVKIYDGILKNGGSSTLS